MEARLLMVMSLNARLLVIASLCSHVMATQPLFPRIEDSKTVYDNIMSTYNSHILPAEGTRPFDIIIAVELTSVGEIDELDEKLATVMSIAYVWQDKNISWNNTEMNVKVMTFGWTDVWKPVLRVANPYAEYSINRDKTRSYDSVMYDSSGLAFFKEIMITRTTCDLDMTSFPFDVQTCFILLRIIGDSDFPIRVFPSFIPNEVLHSTVEHRTWTLLEKNITATGGRIQIELKFRRQPLFTILNILMPVIVVAFLTPIVFVLPKDSSDRVAFSITMFLAISVYMTIVCNHLPQNSEPLPLVSLLLFIWYILDALIVTIVIMNKRIYETRNTKTMPYILRKIVLISGVIFVINKRKRKAEVGSIDEMRAFNDNDTADGELGKDINKLKMKDRVDKSNSGEAWKDLSKYIDMYCFFLFYLLKITLPVVFFSTMISNN